MLRYKIMRGGHLDVVLHQAWVSLRYWNETDFRDNSYGLRVVMGNLKKVQ